MLYGCFFALGCLFFLVGIVELLSSRGSAGRSAPPMPRRTSTFIPVPNNPLKPSSPLPPAVQAAKSTLPTEPRGAMNTPQKLTWIKIGNRIRIRGLQQGELTLHVLGSVTFAELWQTSRGPQAPWVPTGQQFIGFWLETNRFLLNWLNRFYLLDEAIPTSDVEIQRDFAPHAKKFAQSNQTADIHFEYPPAVWHIDDIGKFSIADLQGEGFNTLTPHAVGRFIHCSGDSRRALVLEDYEGGGGPDTVWLGTLIDENDIQPA